MLQSYIHEVYYNTDSGPDLIEVLKVFQERCSTLVDLAEEIRFIYDDFDDYDEKQAKKQFKQTTLPILESLKQQYEELDDWTAEAIHQVVENTVNTLQLGFGKVGQPLRLAVTGHGKSPSIDVTLELLGKDKTLRRLERAINFIAA